MTLRAWLSRVKAVVSRSRAEGELDDELSFHIAMQSHKHREAGMDAAAAEARARLEFGNVELVKEDARDVRGVRPLEDAVQDVRYALRSLARAPAFALSVIATIGIGVGITSSAFTVLDAYLLRPFDVRDPGALFSVNWMDREGRYHDLTRADVDALRHANGAVADVMTFRTVRQRLGAAVAAGDAVSVNAFDMLGVHPAIGRMFRPDDAALPVVVLSHDAWTTRFGSDSSILGRRVPLWGSAFVVIGVARPGYTGLFKKPRDFWVPFAAADAVDPTRGSAARRDDAETSVVARLASGVTASQARAAIGAVLQASTANRSDGARAIRVSLESRESPIASSVRAYAQFMPLVASFGLILLLACANVANVLLARGMERRRELGIRLALGAARARLVRQLVTESIVLMLPAAAVGFGLAWFIVTAGTRAVFATLPADLAPFVRSVPLEADWRVVVFALLSTIGSAVVCGLAPSLRATRLSVVEATRGTFGESGQQRTRRGALVIGQVAASSLLLITATILLREASRLSRTETGLRTSDVVSVEPQPRFRSAVRSALEANRTVDAVASSSILPLDMKFPSMHVMTGDSVGGEVVYDRVSANYFDVLKIAIVAGRPFDPADEQAHASSVIITEATARRLWPGTSPIGRSIRVRTPPTAGAPDSASRDREVRVVGIARDVVVGSVADGKGASLLYFPNSRELEGCCFLARVRGDPDAAKRALDADLDRTVPGGVERIDRLETLVAGSIYPFRAAYFVAAILGIIALALTAVGVYGVVAYLIGQRTREIGIRIALGALTSDVLLLTMRQAFRQATVGALIGCALAVLLARVISANLPGVPAFDGVAFVTASISVVAACLVAAFVPSRRASAIDPTAALRHD